MHKYTSGYVHFSSYLIGYIDYFWSYLSTSFVKKWVVDHYQRELTEPEPLTLLDIIDYLYP